MLSGLSARLVGLIFPRMIISIFILQLFWRQGNSSIYLFFLQWSNICVAAEFLFFALMHFPSQPWHFVLLGCTNGHDGNWVYRISAIFLCLSSWSYPGFWGEMRYNDNLFMVYCVGGIHIKLSVRLWKRHTYFLEACCRWHHYCSTRIYDLLQLLPVCHMMATFQDPSKGYNFYEHSLHKTPTKKNLPWTEP